MAKLEPYDWQLKDLETLRNNNYTGLIAIEAGGGKSIAATLAIAEAQPEVVLIVAPLSTHESAWIPTVESNAGRKVRVMSNKLKKEKEALADFEWGVPGVYICTPQFLTRSDVSEWRGDMIVVDEIHQGITPKTKFQRKLSGYMARASEESLTDRFPMRLALSGTPFRQDFSNAWGIMRFLWPEYSGSGEIANRNFILWQSERMDYKTVYTNRRDRNGNPQTVKKYLAETTPGRLVSEIPCVIIHKRRSRCCDAHLNGFLTTEEPQTITRTVTLTSKQKKSVSEMSEIMMTFLVDQPLVAEIPLTQKQRIRQLTLAEAIVDEDGVLRYEKDTESPVADEVIHILQNLPEGEPVVAFVESQKFAEVLIHQVTKAGFQAAEYSGVRKAELSKFGTDYQVLVGVVSAIGTGTDGIQRQCSTEIWAEQPISLTNKTQSQARLDRMGGRQVQRYVLLDDLGVQEGRLEDLITAEAQMQKSLQVRS